MRYHTTYLDTSHIKCCFGAFNRVKKNFSNYFWTAVKWVAVVLDLQHVSIHCAPFITVYIVAFTSVTNSTNPSFISCLLNRPMIRVSRVLYHIQIDGIFSSLGLSLGNQVIHCNIYQIVLTCLTNLLQLNIRFQSYAK